MTFGEKLNEFKEKTKMTNLEIASLLGVPLRTFEDWKSNRRVPSSFIIKQVEFLLYNYLSRKRE